MVQDEPQQVAPAALTREQINRQRALESQMQSLYELEYRDEVLAYMHEMEVSSARICFGLFALSPHVSTRQDHVS